MTIALMTIATGEVYRAYAQNMFNSARKYFPQHNQIVFTDDPGKMLIHWSDIVRSAFQVESYGYPQATLYRYKMFTRAEWLLREYDYLFYVDADMEFVAPVGDIFSNLTATLHPGFVGKKGSPETRRESTAFCDFNKEYYCGGFQGGRSDQYLALSHVCKERIETDEKNGIVAVWHDESHWNKVNAEVPPSKVLSPSYCYPEDYDGGYGWTKEQFPPILVALDKRKRGNHPRFK